MNNKTKKQELAARVSKIQVNIDILELAAAKDLKSKGEHQQRHSCSECGKKYLGQKNSSTCGDTCRQRKSRS